MAYVIAEPCIDVKDTACVDACPVDCIHPRKNESDFAGSVQLYIDPVECIDCGACARLSSVGNFCPGGFTGKMEALHKAECGSLCSQVIVKLGLTHIQKSRRRNARS
jgi:NAD-dependent dihydropyrimidine dehydrogenase PreA subunit